MSSPVQPSLLGRINERQILRAIQELGPLSRADLARNGGISAPTASKAVDSLLRSGMLEEVDSPEATRGRPAKLLRLPNGSAQVVGVVLDAEKCHVISAGIDGVTVEDSGSFPTPETYEALLSAIEVKVLALSRASKAQRLGMGICMPGLIDYRRQTGLLSPNLPLTNERPLLDDLSARLNMRCVLLQESHALCLAELRYGAAKGLDDFAMMDIGVGIGLGVMSGGRLLTGTRGLAGEVGHITLLADGPVCGCGNTGCLETVASTTALVREISRIRGRAVSLDELHEEKAKPTDDVRMQLAQIAEYAGIGIAAVINLFNPATLFLHSRMFDLDPTLFDRMRGEAQKRALRPSYSDCKLVMAKGSKRQGAVAGIVEHLVSSVVPAGVDGGSIPGLSPWSGSVVTAPLK